MNAEQHALHARAMADQANHYSYGDGGDAATGLALAAEGIVHALLSLRPGPQVVELKVGEAAPIDDDADPDELPWGTVVTATVDGRECVRLVRSDLSAVSWYVHPDDVRDGMTWAIGGDLRDVRVVRVGPKL